MPAASSAVRYRLEAGEVEWEFAPGRRVRGYGFAWIHFGLGEIDEAFVWLDKAIDERDYMVYPLKTYPFLDPIRNDPRFRALLEKMKLEP